MSPEVQELLEEHECLVMEEFAEACLGVAWRFGMEPVALYDYVRVIEILVADGLTEEEAEEHFNFNIQGAWVGDKTPAFVRFS